MHISSWWHISWSHFRTRFRAFLRRYGRILSLYSIVITYLTAIIIICNLREPYLMAIYGIILALLGFLLLVVLVGMFICSLFPRGRKQFDKWFGYADIELVSTNTRLRSLERQTKDIQSKVVELDRKIREDELILKERMGVKNYGKGKTKTSKKNSKT